VGYSYFPIYLDKSLGCQALETSTNVILHEGLYQIPVHA
jgi:hypothetical protein